MRRCPGRGKGRPVVGGCGGARWRARKRIPSSAATAACARAREPPHRCAELQHMRAKRSTAGRAPARLAVRGAAPLRLGLCTATMATAWTVQTTAWDGGARLPAAPVGAAAAAAGLSKPPSRSSTDAGAAAAGAAPRPAPEPGTAGATGAAAARGAGAAGSVPSDAAMVGSTLMSDSFLGPRPPSAAAPCAPRPRSAHHAGRLHTDAARARHLALSGMPAPRSPVGSAGSDCCLLAPAA